MPLVGGARWSFRGKDAGLKTRHPGEQRGPMAQVRPVDPTS